MKNTESPWFVLLKVIAVIVPLVLLLIPVFKRMGKRISRRGMNINRSVSESSVVNPGDSNHAGSFAGTKGVKVIRHNNFIKRK